MADSVTQSGNPRRRDIPSQVTDRIIRYDTGFTSSEDEYQHNTKPQYIVENTDDVYRGFDELTPNRVVAYSEDHYKITLSMEYQQIMSQWRRIQTTINL